MSKAVRQRKGRQPEAEELGFEDALARLEGLVERLESPDLPLEEALETFEAGVALTRRCSEQLEAAERRIEVLVREGGRYVARPHELEGEPDAASSPDPADGRD